MYKHYVAIAYLNWCNFFFCIRFLFIYMNVIKMRARSFLILVFHLLNWEQSHVLCQGDCGYSWKNCTWVSDHVANKLKAVISPLWMQEEFKIEKYGFGDIYYIYILCITAAILCHFRMSCLLQVTFPGIYNAV